MEGLRQFAAQEFIFLRLHVEYIRFSDYWRWFELQEVMFRNVYRAELLLLATFYERY